jgi:hypothetical protein
MDSYTLKRKALRFVEISGTARRTTQCHIPEHLYLQQHRCENLKLRSDVNLDGETNKGVVRKNSLTAVDTTNNEGLDYNKWPLRKYVLRS